MGEPFTPSIGVRLRAINEPRKVRRELREGAYMLAHQFPGRHSRTALVSLYAADRSRGVIPGAEQ